MMLTQLVGSIQTDCGSVFSINGTSALRSTTLGSNVVVISSLTSIGILNNGTDPLIITNSGNVNFKMTASSITRRWETQTGGDYYLWDESNNQIVNIESDKQCWWKNDVNTTGGFYSNGFYNYYSAGSLKPTGFVWEISRVYWGCPKRS